MSEPPDLKEAHPWKQRLARLRAPARQMFPFGLGALTVFVGLALAGFFQPAPPQLTENQINDLVATVMQEATPQPSFSSLVYQRIFPSLVLIETERPDGVGEPEFGLGSGVVVNLNGEILTSLHVVAGAESITVSFTDGSQTTAEILAAQPENDIAVLRPARLPDLVFPATLGNPNALRVGDEAFVLGNPLGLAGSMSAGVISGFERSFTPQFSEQRLEGLIQFDAAVNPGNSGGPLLNRSGQVVGIVTALANPTEESVFIGIGFAVPINVAVGAAGAPPY